MQVSIDEVVVRKRIRTDLGNLDALMASLRKHGQLNPILITRDSLLVAGHRRLESARRLGWQTINAVVLERADEVEKLEIEIEENVQRKQLTPEELAEALARLDRLKNPGWLRRVWRWLRALLLGWFGGA
jgi:ParB family chromosome partitioning protein